ncbi:maf protein, partial [Acidithiobacillus sp. GGI-221]
MTRLILASASPRRLALLQQLGYAPEVMATDVDESPRPGESPDALALRLAHSKGLAAATARPEAVI